MPVPQSHVVAHGANPASVKNCPISQLGKNRRNKRFAKQYLFFLANTYSNLIVIILRNTSKYLRFPQSHVVAHGAFPASVKKCMISPAIPLKTKQGFSLRHPLISRLKNPQF